MKKQLCVFSCILVVLLVAKVEWENRSQQVEPASKTDLGQKEEILLRNVQVSERALESHKLPVRSEAAIVLDTRKGEVLFEKNIRQRLPIASLTKLMSVLVFLEGNPRLDNFTTITTADADCPGNSELSAGETIIFRDLLHACLMNSSNRATRALARVSGLSFSEFVTRMNLKSKELGLRSTFFCEPTGLSEKNRSTALDCARLLYFALRDSTIASILGRAEHNFVSLDPSRSMHRIRSANSLLFDSLDVKGCKTGYNGPSGWCLGVMVEDTSGKEVVAVVLGAPDKPTRYKDIRSMVDWCMEADKKPTRKS
jgi:D-alanyl-D-alanine endopeptidase (penicillin-binding protein 7)